MKVINHFLFPRPIGEMGSSLLILFFRLFIGAFILVHGITKCIHFSAMAEHFPSPIGIGSKASLILVIFAEVVCALGFLTGFLYRLSLIAMIFSFSVIVFVVSAHANFQQKELPLVYLLSLVLLFLSGPGKYSIDYLIGKKIRNN